MPELNTVPKQRSKNENTVSMVYSNLEKISFSMPEGMLNCKSQRPDNWFLLQTSNRLISLSFAGAWFGGFSAWLGVGPET